MISAANNSDLNDSILDDSTAIELVHGLPPQQVFDRLHQASRGDGMSSRMLAFYLEELHSRRIYQTSGHASTAHWAADQLDMDERRARELVQIGDALRENEELDAALLDGRLSWSKVVMLASIVMQHTQVQWIELAMQKNCAQIRRDVARARAGRNPRDGGEASGENGGENDCENGSTEADGGKGGLPGPRFRFQASYDTDAQNSIEQIREEVMRDVGKLVTDDELFAWLLERGQERVSARAKKDAARPTESEPLGSTDKIPLWMRKMVLARDGFVCQCCDARTKLHLHHIVFREHGGATTPENLLTTCNACHGRIHAGLLVVQGTAPGEIEISGKNGDPLRRTSSSAEPVLRILRQRNENVGTLREPAADIRRGNPPSPNSPNPVFEKREPQTSMPRNRRPSTWTTSPRC